PVGITSVTAKWQKQDVLITWQVTNETGIEQYIIEKSADNRNFSAAGEVTYQYSSNGNNVYTFRDIKNDGSEITYYRIKAVSRGTEVIYSRVVSTRAQDDPEATAISVSPNPATGATASIR